MRKFKPTHKNLLICAAALMLFAAANLRAQTNPTSSESQRSVTVKQSTLDAANKAFDELDAQDKLIEAQDAQIKLLGERLETEKEKSNLLAELAESRRRQAESLTEANNALQEAVAAKDAVIVNKDKEIKILEKKKPKILTIVKAVAAGVAIGLILK